MGTWRDDIRDPKLRQAYSIVGNQDRHMLRNMVTALKIHRHLNTQAEEARLAAALYILRHRHN